MIREALARKTICVTGTTGFLGKSVVEKLLRDVPEVGRIIIAVRSSARRSAVERLDREILASPAFRRLEEELGEERFRALAAEKLRVLAIDLDEDGLGLTAEGRELLASCDVVVHSAAAVEFDNPADFSAQTNLWGAARLVEAVRETGARPHLVHVSTAYVGGMLRGRVEERLPHDPGLNWRHEATILSGLRQTVEEESRRPELLAKLASQARQRMGPAGTPATARATERLRDRWAKDAMVERGRAHARAMGFTDIYSFTKAMAERAVVELHGEIPLSIVRPSIIESALNDPFPGWLEGFRMAEPIILAFGRGVLTDFSGLPDAPLDIIPVDYVVNTVLAVAATAPPAGEHRIYHAASGSRNPLRLRRLHDEAAEYFTAHPLRDRYGQAIGAPTWTFPTRTELRNRGRLALRAVETLQATVERLPLGPRGVRWSDELHERRTTLDRSLTLLDLYAIYVDVDAIFDNSNVLGLWERMPDEERATFPLDPAGYDWAQYLQGVHFPTVIRMARADTTRRGPAPDGSTKPREASNTALAALRRRSGREDVLAVFDVDGTLVETNVVEYYFWMRLRDQPASEWPRFLARMARRAPHWLALERTSRADFQRSFYREYAGLDAEEMRHLGREALDAVTLRRLYPEGVRRIREHQRAGHRVLLLTGAMDVVVEPLAELLGVEVDCAHLLIDGDGRMTGDLVSPPPAGEARGALLERYAAGAGVDLSSSFAYADALSDLPMLEMVGTPVAVNPDARLSQLAGQRGWRVERWRMPPGNWRLPVPDPRSPSYRLGVRGGSLASLD